jgi:hypothetical protein
LALRSILPFFHSNKHRHSSPPNNSNKKYATVEDAVASFPRPIIPTVQGEPDYQTIHAIRKLLQANSRAIDTHGGVWDTLASLSLTQLTPVSHPQAKMDQSLGPTQQPQDEHRQFWTREPWHNSAQSDTLGRKQFSPTASSTRCNKCLTNKSSLFFSQCTWTF